MNTPEPIRDRNKLADFKNYYKKVNPNIRNRLLITIGMNTALRISDILKLTYNDVYDFNSKVVKQHIVVKEKKTGKIAHVYINAALKHALSDYVITKAVANNFCINDLLFKISRVQAWRIIKKAAVNCGIEGVISCHSMRKTFGYFAWKQGIEPALLMDIFNHSSYAVTKRYLGITQEDRDNIYKSVEL